MLLGEAAAAVVQDVLGVSRYSGGYGVMVSCGVSVFMAAVQASFCSPRLNEYESRQEHPAEKQQERFILPSLLSLIPLFLWLKASIGVFAP